jgi:hypothetical protein
MEKETKYVHICLLILPLMEDAGSFFVVHMSCTVYHSYTMHRSRLTRGYICEPCIKITNCQDILSGYLYFPTRYTSERHYSFRLGEPSVYTYPTNETETQFSLAPAHERVS